MLAGVERLVAGDPVDRDERPVEDDVGVTCPFSVPDRFAQFRGAGREQFDGLVHVPPGGGPADPEPGREVLERFAFSQVGEHEEGFLARVELPPPRPDRHAVPADDPGRVVEGLGRQRQRGAVEKHAEAPGGDESFLVDCLIYQGLRRARRRTAALWPQCRRYAR